MTAHDVTVVITVFNAAATLSIAIESAALLSPSSPILVLDDGSTDDSAAVARDCSDRFGNVSVHELGRVGRAAALNAGFELVSSEFAAILDADDAAIAPRFGPDVAVLRADPRLGMVGGSYIRLDLDRDELRQHSYPSDDRSLRRALAYYGPFCHSTVTYRVAAVRDVGGFDPSLPSRIDQDLWVRLAARGWRLANVDAELAIHTKSGDSFFIANQSERERAATMLRRNAAAIRELDLPKWLYAVAVARAAYRFVPMALRSRVTPDLAPISPADLAPDAAELVARLQRALHARSAK